ncbi:MAG TPA: YraN family protein [Thermoflexales bacterium]|nr:YraN family protein [Anaerolineae bacterium]HQV28739.1 YraN family protein [Thermoflexales bacterium]HQX11763.1 YraN family protein [Thermoflexales bacterium]HQZ53192.1 YraN family protein [Thermoflexales bacterium]HRA53573.1 YraN family protein [Thermoflexales bacterium]
MPARKETGDWGEAIAVRHLEDKGYVVVARNWRHGHGELDLIVEHGGVIVFVEVRARHGEAYGAPEETLGPAKRAKLAQTAQAWLSVNERLDSPARFDVIAIDLNPRNEVARITHYENAF